MCPADGTSLRADPTVAVTTASDPLFGLVLDEKYRLDARLGEGGMGTVYRAAHLLIDRPVAVKVLHPRFVEDEAAQQRFRREARAAGRLQHPNAVTVTDFGSTADGYVYLVMELLEGETLRDLLSTEAPLTAGHAVELMSQVAAAVEAAHEAGVIHRDLKPGNIFVVRRKDSPPVLKVLDFGIAKLAAESLDDSDAKNLTQTGVMIGTPRYMSPEQCDGEKLTPASDVYSLGIILYEMLTGMPPFTGPTPLAVALQHSSKLPRPPRELMPSIPAEFEQVVLHALAKSPGERPGDAGEFRRELLETARRLGLQHHPAALHPPHAVPATPDGGKAGPDKLVIDLEKMREERAAATASELPAGGAGLGETTVLADTSERAKFAAASVPATVPAGGAISELFSLRPETFTRFRVNLQKRNPWLQRLTRPPVLIALLSGALVLAVAVAGFVKSGGTPDAAALTVDNANAAAASSSPEVTPSATPTTGGGAGKQAVRKRPANRTANARPQKKSGNRVKRALKKIFNPF